MLVENKVRHTPGEVFGPKDLSLKESEVEKIDEQTNQNTEQLNVRKNPLHHVRTRAQVNKLKSLDNAMDVVKANHGNKVVDGSKKIPDRNSDLEEVKSSQVDREGA